MTTYLAVDLETVLDVELGRKVWPVLAGADDAATRAGMRAIQLEASGGKSDFMKPLFHQIVALGLAFYDPMTGKGASVSYAGPDEPKYLDAFMDAIRKRPTLVTYNGRQFDLCVIRHRALIHGIDCRNLYGAANQKSWDSYDYRYGGPHLDLGDVLTGYGACAMPKLNELLLAMDEAPKTDDGSRVEGMWEARELDRLAAYVRQDARKTLKLALDFEVCRGRLDDYPEELP